jgi:hypothetical protein
MPAPWIVSISADGSSKWCMCQVGKRVLMKVKKRHTNGLVVKDVLGGSSFGKVLYPLGGVYDMVSREGHGNGHGRKPTFPGSETIMWQSRKASVCSRRHLMIGAPRVIFGTKWPSITSEQG